MPHKYEREIEEILRNLDDPEPPTSGYTDRIRSFQRPATRTPRRAVRPRPSLRLRLTLAEGLIFTGIALALISAGMAYYLTHPNMLSGGIAIAGFILILFGFARSFANRGSVSAPSQTAWRTATIIEARPIRARRRNPFSEVATQFRILRLKIRYWRAKNK